MSIYHRVDTTCQTQKYVLQQQCLFITTCFNTTCQTQKYVLQQQCLFITELIPRVRHKSTYYNNNVYLSQSWYHVSDTKVRITTTIITELIPFYLSDTRVRITTTMIPRVRHKSTYYNNNVYLSQSWYHVSDTKVRITTTMSIYHRVNTTCQTQKYVLQQQCLFITELIPRVRHKSTYSNNNVYLSQSWYHVSDPKWRITTTMSIYHRVDTTCQTQKYVLQQQCLFITELIPRVRQKYVLQHQCLFITELIPRVTQQYNWTNVIHRVDTTCQTQKYVLQQQCLFITELIPRVRTKSTYYNNNVYLSQSWYHVSDPKVRITTTMSIYHRVDNHVSDPKVRITTTMSRSQSWYHVSDPKVRITTTMSIYHRVVLPRVRPKSTYYNNNVYLSHC